MAHEDLDDFDSILDEMDDFDMEENSEPKELGTREVVSEVTSGALDTLTSQEFLTDNLSAVTKHALPKGYDKVLSAADATVKDTIDLYNKVATPLKGPIKDLKKLVKQKEGELPDFLPESVKERVSKWADSDNEAPTSHRVNPDDMELASAMDAVFGLQQGQLALSQKDTALALEARERTEASGKASLMLEQGIERSLNQLVGYQNGINYKFQQKSLELQHMHYFSSRDTLAVLRAFASDTGTNLKAINHNSALPDAKKIHLTEGFMQTRNEKLFGTVNDSLDSFTDGFLGDFKKNLGERAAQLGESLGDGIGGLLSMQETMADSEMTTAMKIQMAGGMAVGFAGDKLSPVVGKKIKRLLERNPELQKQSKELMYLFENMGTELNDKLADWDGRVFPSSLTEKYPALDIVNASAIKDVLTDTLTTYKGNHLEVISGIPKGEETTPVSWDALSRKTLIEVIPGLLSRQLQMQEILATGEERDLMTYSVDTGAFVRQGEEASRLEEKMFGDYSQRQNKYTDALLKVIGAGSGVELSKDAEKALRKYLVDGAVSGRSFKIDKLANDTIGSETQNTEIQKMLAESKGDVAQRNLSGSRIYKELASHQTTLQEQINSMQARGSQDLLSVMGLTETVNGETVINRDAYLNKSLGDLHNRHLGNKSKSFKGSDHNFKTDGLRSPEFDLADIRKEFFDEIDQREAIPVYMTNHLTSGGIDTKASVDEGFYAVLESLGRIEGAIVAGGIGDPRTNASGGIFSSGFTGMAKNLMGGAGTFTKRYYEGLGSFSKGFGSGAGSIIAGTLTGTSSFLRDNRPRDIYVEGESEPVLTAAKLRAGEYIDSLTGKVITSFDKVKGNILDRAGNVVVTKETLSKRLTDSTGTVLSGLSNRFRNLLNEGLDINSRIVNIGLKAPGQVMSLLRSYNEKIRDVYVPGEAKPRLHAFMFKNGGYFSKKTGQVLRSPKDIDGEVVDSEGNVVLTIEDIGKGIVDNLGTAIGNSRLVSMARNSIGRVVGVGKKMIAKPLELGTSILTSMRDGMGSLLECFNLNQIMSIQKRDSESTDVLNKIYGFMVDRWTTEEVRTGSWQDLASREDEEVVTDLNEDKPKGKEKNSKKEKTDNSGVIGLLGGISNGIGSMVDKFKSVATLLAGWFAWSKSSSAAEAVGEDLDDFDMDSDSSKKKPKTKTKKGILGKALSWGKKAVSGAGRLALGAVPMLASGLSTAASGVASLASGAASVISAPVVLGAAAVAGIAYGSYKLYEHYAGPKAASNQKEPRLEQLRYLQYGIPANDTEFQSIVRRFEENIMENIGFTGSIPTFNLSVADVLKENAGLFDIDINDAYASQEWGNWFAKRFMPIFIGHVQAAREIDKTIDVLNIGNEMDVSQMVEFVTRVTKDTGGELKAIYSVRNVPLDGHYVYTNEKGIVALSREIIDAISNIHKTVESEKTGDTTIATKDFNDATIIKPNAYYTSNSILGPRLAKQVTSNITSPSATLKGTKAIGTLTKTRKSSFIMPMEGTITSPFGMRVHPIKKTRKQHKGIDIAAAKGTAIHAADDGVIYRCYYSKSYGRVIYIKHSDGMATRYAHMSAFEPGLMVGSEVAQGDIIGYCGNSGASAGNHLHWELRKTTDQWAEALDPLLYVDSQYRKDLEKEEKAILAAEKNAESTEDSIEGLNTVGVTKDTPTLDAPLVPALPSNSTNGGFSTTEAASNSSGNGSATVVKVDMAKGMSATNALLQKQIDAGKIAVNQNSQIVEVTEKMYDSMSEMLTLLATISNKETTVTLSQTSSSNNTTKVQSVVDLTN